MKIQLKNWKVKNLSFKINEYLDGESKEKNNLDLSVGDTLIEGKTKEFGIGFLMNIEDEEFNIHLEMIFLFETDDVLNEEFMSSSFVKINAPAIAFPYVRSFVSNITLQSGFSPVILPSINFVELAKEKKLKEKSE